MSLKTDYKDYTYSGSQKFKITDNGDGTSSITDSTTYSQVGDTFGASDLNATNTAVNSIEEKIENLGTQKVIYDTPRWLRFNPSNKKGLIIKANTKIKKANGEYQSYTSDTTVDLSSYITANGADYFVFLDNSGNITCQTTTTKSNAVKIGRFHTLCVNAGTMTMIAPDDTTNGVVGNYYLVKPYREDTDPDFYAFYRKQITAITKGTYYNVCTMSHPLSGFSANDILPESVFCLTWYPNCLVEDAMVYDKTTDNCIDIYLQSGTGCNTRSKYNATHTVSRQPINHQADMNAVGKKLLTDNDFMSCALGSNEKTNITGSSDKTTVGGHSDTAGRRMISAIGCEECCGYLWQWLDEIAPTGGSGWVSYSDGDYFGQSYGLPYVLQAGGDWTGGSACGSRSRVSDGSRAHVGSYNGSRGSSRIVNC
jgi:hypothetical protein